MKAAMARGLEAERRADERDRRPAAYFGNIVTVRSHVRRGSPGGSHFHGKWCYHHVLQAWPLIIDAQVQGVKWLKQKQEKDGFVPCLLTQKNWIRAMRGGISDGMCVIIENLGEEIDATLDPVLSRAIYKKGSSLYIKFGGEEMNYDPAFSFYMQTRLDNPHYKPEIAAQCTLINFIATERGWRISS